MLSALFTTSCEEMMSNLDQPVSSYLSVKEADVVVPTGDTYQIEITSNINSDKPVTYKSSDEKVATVDAKGLVTGVADGEATITVAVEASDYYQAGEQKIQVAVKRPLTFEAQADGSVYVDFSNGVTLEKPIYYSVDGGEKVPFTAWVEIPLKKGQKVEFESANDHVSYGAWSRGLRFWPGMECAVYGNVMSLISPDGNYHVNKEITVPGALFGLFSGDEEWKQDEYYNWYIVEYPNSKILSHDTYKLELPATTLASSCYGQMFKLCSGLKKAPILPATELADYCYQYMFEKCYNLTKAPKLSATTMKDGCYGYMFEYCSALEEAPALPATKLANYCYQQMFYGCTLLTEAPALPATTMTDYCYANMFSNCTKLAKAPALPATKLAPYCYGGMFYNCSSLTAAPALPATTLANNCYEWMFESCVKLAAAPALPATKMVDECYQGMFYNCQKLKAAPALPATDLAPWCYAYMFANCSELSGSVELPATTLVEGCYYQMFVYCSKFNNLKCLATANAPQALQWWLAGAGTDESVTSCTFTRSTDNNNWFNANGMIGYVEAWAVPNEWTITPTIEAMSAPARAASSVDKVELLKDFAPKREAYPTPVPKHM